MCNGNKKFWHATNTLGKSAAWCPIWANNRWLARWLPMQLNRHPRGP